MSSKGKENHPVSALTHIKKKFVTLQPQFSKASRREEIAEAVKVAVTIA